MQLAVLLRRHGGKSAAAGWDGDRYAVFEGREGRVGLVWFSTWDTDDEAREFFRGYVRFQTTKLGDGASPPEAFPDSVRRPHKGTVFAVERRGRDVVVVEGFPVDPTDALVEAAFTSKKTEMTYAPAGTADKGDGQKPDERR